MNLSPSQRPTAFPAVAHQKPSENGAGSAASRVTRTPRLAGSGILMVMAAVLICVHLGRPFDYVLIGLHLPAVLSAIALAGGLAGGGLHILKTRVGLALIALIVWMAAVTPLSSYVGIGAPYVARFAFNMISFLLLVSAAPRSLNDLKKLMVLTALVPTLLILLTNLPGGRTSRYRQPAPNGEARMELSGYTYGNSADVGLVTGFTVPFWVFIGTQFKLPLLQAPMALAAIVYLSAIGLLSGTRAALVAAAGMFVVYVVTGGVKRKVLLIAAAGASMIIVPVFLPRNITQRFGTILESFYDTSRPVGEANESAAQRIALLKDSVRYTLENPLLGVGPGQFADHRFQEALDEGRPRQYLVAHNTYTQISSECGIPGLLLFIAVLWGVFKTILNARRIRLPNTHPDARLARSMGLCLLASLVYYAICAFFMTLPLYIHPMLVGSLALALERTTKLAAAVSPDSVQQLGIADASLGPSTVRGRFPAPVQKRFRYHR